MNIKRKGTVPSLWNMQQEFIAPFSQIFDSFVDQHFPELKDNGTLQFAKGAYPKVDVIETPNGVNIHAEVAGWKKEDIELTVENSILTISGKSQSDTPEFPEPLGDHRYIVKEIKRSSFSRTFRLGNNLDTSKIAAHYTNGTLIIVIEKLKYEPIDNSKRYIGIG